MESKEIKDITIIGAGPVGLYCAFYAGLRGLNGYLLESNNEIGGQAMMLYKEKQVLDLPGHYTLTGKEVIKNLFNQYQRFENDIILKTNFKVFDIKWKKDHFIIVDENGRKILSKTIILSIGPGAISPIKLNIENEDKFDISYLIKDLSSFYNKKVVIFGGGNSALDWAKALSKKANVSLVHRRSIFRGNMSTIEEIKNNVSIFKPYKLTKIDEKSIYLNEKKTNSQKIINYDKIIVQYGLKSIYGNAKKWGLEWEKGRIKVDPWKATNIKGIWAIGNSCYYEGKNYIITTGLSDAIVAISAIVKFLNPKALTTFYSTDIIK